MSSSFSSSWTMAPSRVLLRAAAFMPSSCASSSEGGEEGSGEGWPRRSGREAAEVEEKDEDEDEKGENRSAGPTASDDREPSGWESTRATERMRWAEAACGYSS